MQTLTTNDSLDIAEQAGIVRWDADENPMRPVDWASDYSDELLKFAQLIFQEAQKATTKEWEDEAFQIAKEMLENRPYNNLLLLANSKELARRLALRVLLRLED